MDKAGSDGEHLFSSKFACPVCNYSLPELEPRLFSFNSPVGACPTCDGLGHDDRVRRRARRRLPVAQPGERRGQGLGPAQRLHVLAARERRRALRLRHRHCRSRSCPSRRARGAAARLGRRRDRVRLRGRGRARQAAHGQAQHPFEGILPNLERRFRETDSAAVREDLARYQSAKPCPDCHGARLRARGAPRLPGRRRERRRREPIFRVEHFTLRECLDYFERLDAAGREGRDRRQGGARDLLAPEVPERRRPQLPEPRPQRRHAVGRRGAAHPPRLADRLRA